MKVLDLTQTLMPAEGARGDRTGTLFRSNDWHEIKVAGISRSQYALNVIYCVFLLLTKLCFLLEIVLWLEEEKVQQRRLWQISKKYLWQIGNKYELRVSPSIPMHSS